MFCLTEFILCFINTWIGPRHIIQQENPIYDQNGDNMGGGVRQMLGYETKSMWGELKFC